MSHSLLKRGTLLTPADNGTFVPLAPATPSDLQTPPMTAPYLAPHIRAAYMGTHYRSGLGGGNGAVISMRFDDSPSTDYTSVWPMLTARQLPAAFAVVSGWIGLTGRLTAQQIVAMANSGMEIQSHTHSHDTNPTYSDAYWVQETTSSVQEIRNAALSTTNPAGFVQDCYVEGFVQPGTWLNEPMDCAKPADLEGAAWRYIQATFPGAEGYIREPMLKKVSSSDLDGIKMLPSLYRHGASHTTICPLTAPTGYATTLAYAQALVDACVNFGGYLSLVMHSSSLDTAGNMTTADLTTLLDYIKSYRDQDKVDVLCPTAALYAERATQPFNMLAGVTNPAGSALQPPWAASGSPILQAGQGFTSGSNAIDIDSANSASYPKVQIGGLEEAACRTLHLRFRYKNAVPGAPQVPRVILRYYDGGTNNWVSSDTASFATAAKPTAQDAWTVFDVIARPPRFPPGAGTAPIYLNVLLLATTVGNKVRYASDPVDLILKKV